MGVKVNVITGSGTRPLGLSFRKPDEISSEMISDLLFSIAQSNDSFAITENLEIAVTILKPPNGG